MNITKIAITGGPCAGKTTGLSYLEQKLTQIGYKVVIINECATELILNGLDHNSFTKNIDFERNIVQLQVEKERLYYEFCKTLPYENVLLVCDRGVMDCKCYMTDEEFDQILKELNYDKIQLRDNYDAVFHLVTAAKGAPDAYTKANNLARRENLEEAIESDNKTINCWTGHPHFRVIDNSTDFENKMKRLVKEITSFLGLPKPVEIERRFLIKKPDSALLEKLPNCQKVEIVQTYLNSKPDEEVRIRQRGENDSFIYTLTTKSKTDDPMVRQEIERRISEREYLSLLSNCDASLHQIRKTRYCIVHDGNYYEIDTYPFSKDNAILEIELSNKDASVLLPPYIEVIREVTGDKTFSNRSIAQNIPNELK